MFYFNTIDARMESTNEKFGKRLKRKNAYFMKIDRIVRAVFAMRGFSAIMNSRISANEVDYDDMA